MSDDDDVTISWMLLRAVHLHIFTSSINSVTLPLSLYKGTGSEIIWPKSKPGVPLIVGDFKPLPLIAWLWPRRRKGCTGLEADDNDCIREKQSDAWAYYTYSLMRCVWQSKKGREELYFSSSQVSFEANPVPNRALPVLPHLLPNLIRHQGPRNLTNYSPVKPRAGGRWAGCRRGKNQPGRHTASYFPPLWREEELESPLSSLRLEF